MKITVEETNTTVKERIITRGTLLKPNNKALIHSKGSEIRVQVSENEEEVIVSIGNDGKRIPDEDKVKIFEKRFKNGETGGTGLGLYLVKEILKSYDGDIKVKDSDLGGARFDIYLKKV